MTRFIPTGRHGILVPRHADLHSAVNAGRMGLAGRFRLTTHSPRYGTRVRAEFNNLILDQGLNRVGRGAWFSACQVGTGSTTPATSQTGLAAYLAGTSTKAGADANSFVAGSPPYMQGIFTYRFNTGVATGNISEVGMGWSSSGNNLFSRALILDGGGSPTTITVLSDEMLDVEYTLRCYPPTGDVTGEITLGGVDYDYVLRSMGVGEYIFWEVSSLVSGAAASATGTGASLVYPAASVIGDIYAQPSGTGVGSTSATVDTYVPGDFYRGKAVQWGTSVNPSGGVGVAAFGMGAGAGAGMGAWCKMGFTPAIAKDSKKVLTLEPRISWGRH